MVLVLLPWLAGKSLPKMVLCGFPTGARAADHFRQALGENGPGAPPVLARGAKLAENGHVWVFDLFSSLLVCMEMGFSVPYFQQS